MTARRLVFPSPALTQLAKLNRLFRSSHVVCCVVCISFQPELLTLGDDMHVGFASSTYCSVYTAPNAFTLRKTFIGDR